MFFKISFLVSFIGEYAYDIMNIFLKSVSEIWQWPAAFLRNLLNGDVLEATS